MILTLCSALDRYWPRPFTRASPCAVELPPPRQADDSVAASACSSCVLYPGCSWTSIDEYTLRLVPSALTLFRYVELSSFELILLEASGLRAAWLDLSLCGPVRLSSWTGCSHGALVGSCSRSAARASVGSPVSGGDTTRERGSFGASAAIIAVSARNCCLIANCPAADVALAPLSRSVTVLSASSTLIVVPAPLAHEEIASSAYAPLASGIWPLPSTTAGMCSLGEASAVSTDWSAYPPAGSAMLSKNALLSIGSATSWPSW